MIYLNLFIQFFKVGLFGFGGGLAMLPLIYQTINQVVPMAEDAFANLVGIAQATPGPIAINAATYAGFSASGVLGGIVATLGVALPAFILTSIAASHMDRIRPYLTLVRPATIGLIAAATVIVAKGALTSPFAIAACLISVILMAKTKISPIYIILASGVLGALIIGGIM
ncbi:MAG: chromate transporter [Clostridia bacterium]|nr:chromate transporter [Clostridia bacterium]